MARQSFLQYVAKDILAKHMTDISEPTKGEGGLADIAVVFPNKRASLFLNKALYEDAGHPLWSPAYFTISDLFRYHSELKVPDQIELIFRLYDVYTDVTGSNEPIDHFFSWGQLMLADFDDIDKNLVEADKLFINLEAWQEMKDFSFLTEQQRKSLEDFFGKVAADTALQEKFNDIWRYLGAIYHAYRQSLMADGLAYEGMLYRDVVEKGIEDFHYKKYIFVGFNLLQKVEQRLFWRLKDLGKAEFYWDYDEYYIHGHNDAGRFIRQYLDKFPNELSPARISEGIDPEDIYNNMSKQKNISYISAPTEDIQARYVKQWLSARPEGERAIVMCDEKLLQNVIHCLPEDVGNVNITTGYPLSSTPAATLCYALLNLRLYGLNKDGKHYRLKYVNQLLRHPYAKFISDDCAAIRKELNEHKTYYPSIQQLTDGRDEVMGQVFNAVSTTLLEWMADIFKIVGINSRDEKDPLMHESVFRMYTLLVRLNDLFQQRKSTANADPTPLLLRLLSQLIDSTNIPFHGEPALGIQIMGVLETRNLDFDHILVLSCNEGNMPKGINDASFIPHSLRKGYEMTTIENKVAIYSYYFHSLLQRASDVTLTFNNATDEGRQGEMSRFMLQFMVDNPNQHIGRMTLQSGQSVSPVNRMPIEKTGETAEKLKAIKSLSPTAISRYLRCNLQFYYNSICGLREQDDNEEDEIDNATFGNIFHRTAQLIYEDLSGEGHRNTITKDSLDALAKDKGHIERLLDQAFREKLFKVDDPHFRPRYNGLQLLNRNVLKFYINRLLKLDKETAPFDILALEEDFYDTLTFKANGEDRKITVGGQIDRLDKVGNRLRVIDYKTGRPLSAAQPSVEEIFNPDFVDSKHTVYYLQAFLYSSIIRHSPKALRTVNKNNQPVAPALLFIREAKSKDYNPILKVKDAPAEGRKRATYSVVIDINNVYDEYIDGLRQLLGEIFDESVPFRPTEQKERCENCPYQKFCGL